MATEIDLIVGLGNPGAEYQTTRHNAGFWFVDLLARMHGGNFAKERKLHGEIAETQIAGRRVRLLKPTTFMNLSGQAVSATTNYYKIPLDRVLVAYDELDLPPGRCQLKFDGGGAGHNGIRNVMEHVGTKFWRLRFGVGHPRNETGPQRKVIDHVLQRANADEEALIAETLAEAAAILPFMFEHGAERARNKLHTRKPVPKPASDEEKK